MLKELLWEWKNGKKVPVSYYTRKDMLALKQKSNPPWHNVAKPPEDNADNTAWTWVKIPVRNHAMIGNVFQDINGYNYPVEILPTTQMKPLPPEPDQLYPQKIDFSYQLLNTDTSLLCPCTKCVTSRTSSKP